MVSFILWHLLRNNNYFRNNFQLMVLNITSILSQCKLQTVYAAVKQYLGQSASLNYECPIVAQIKLNITHEPR